MNSNFLDMPWKIGLEIRRRAVWPWVRMYFALNGVPWSSGWKLYGCPVIQRHRASRIEIGKNFSLRSWITSNPLAPYHPAVLSTRAPGAFIRIGDGVGMTGGVICAFERIEIGHRVLIGANCVIVDSDFHPLNPFARQNDPSKAKNGPVVIEDDVFIGMNCLILKGVSIGKGSVVGAGSVVTSSIPPGTVCGGNPARVIRPAF